MKEKKIKEYTSPTLSSRKIPKIKKINENDSSHCYIYIIVFTYKSLSNILLNRSSAINLLKIYSQ